MSEERRERERECVGVLRREEKRREERLMRFRLLSSAIVGQIQKMAVEKEKPTITRLLFCGPHFPASHHYTREYLHKHHPFIQVLYLLYYFLYKFTLYLNIIFYTSIYWIITVESAPALFGIFRLALEIKNLLLIVSTISISVLIASLFVALLPKPIMMIYDAVAFNLDQMSKSDSEKLQSLKSTLESLLVHLTSFKETINAFFWKSHQEQNHVSEVETPKKVEQIETL